MAATKYDSFRDLKKGKYDWKVPARVMNLWRGYTKTGDPFQSFNLLLLDNKRYRVHAFIPGSIAKVMEPKLVVGNLYLFKNFSVKEYKDAEKFRCLHKDIQIVFSNDTKIVDLEESDVFIEKVVFDFFDLADLKILSKQTTYLTDVIGVITTTKPTLMNLRTRNGADQRRLKFDITDGRTSVNVTFWDEFAELFYDYIQGNFETPLIIIIGSARITEFQASVVISNVGCTTFYLNYDHYSVSHMRKMLKEPGFGDCNKSSPTLKLYTVEQIKQFGADMVETELVCEVKIVEVPKMETWFQCFCTSCYNVTQFVDGQYYCSNCSRVVPHPQKWFEFCIIASDETGVLDIILENLPAKKCFGKSVEDIVQDNPDNIPGILKTIKGKKYTMKLLIKGENIQQRNKFYIATDIMEGSYLEAINDESEESAPKPVQESFFEASGSSYHLDSLSETNS